MDGRAVGAVDGVLRWRETIHPWHAGIGQGVGEHGVLGVKGGHLLCRTATFWCKVWGASGYFCSLRPSMRLWWLHGRKRRICEERKNMCDQRQLGNLLCHCKSTKVVLEAMYAETFTYRAMVDVAPARVEGWVCCSCWEGEEEEKRLCHGIPLQKDCAQS